MRNRPLSHPALILIALLAFAPLAAGQTTARPGGPGFSFGLNLGYLSRALGLDGEEPAITPHMTSLLASLVLEYRPQPGFTLAAQVGYSSSQFKDLAFRRLPFSLEIDADSGSMGGILLGAEVEKSLVGGSSFGVDIRGQFLASLGLNKEWPLPGLAVEGTAKGKPTWMKASVGPVLTYRGWKGVTPYLYPCFDYLWGTFKFEETIQDLSGSETKDIKSKSRLGLGLGADFEASPSLRFRAEGGIYPRSGGTDFSISVQTLLAF
jgi:hypothetical protein